MIFEKIPQSLFFVKQVVSSLSHQLCQYTTYFNSVSLRMWIGRVWLTEGTLPYYVMPPPPSPPVVCVALRNRNKRAMWRCEGRSGLKAILHLELWAGHTRHTLLSRRLLRSEWVTEGAGGRGGDDWFIWVPTNAHPPDDAYSAARGSVVPI